MSGGEDKCEGREAEKGEFVCVCLEAEAPLGPPVPLLQALCQRNHRVQRQKLQDRTEQNTGMSRLSPPGPNPAGFSVLPGEKRFYQAKWQVKAV